MTLVLHRYQLIQNKIISCGLSMKFDQVINSNHNILLTIRQIVMEILNAAMTLVTSASADETMEMSCLH